MTCLLLCLSLIVQKTPLPTYPSRQDTLRVITLLQKADQLSDSLTTEAIELNKEAAQLSLQLNYNRGIAQSFRQLGWVFHLRSNYDSAIYYYKNSLTYSPSLDREKMIASQGIGESYMRLFESDSARKYLHEALTIAQEKKDKGFEGGIYNSLGNVSLNENRFEEALDHFIQSANHYEQAGDKAGLSKALSNVGNIEYRMGNYEKAIDYANQSIRLAEESGHFLGLAYCHKLLGWIYRKQNKLQEALQEHQAAFSIYEKIDASRDASETSLSIGNIYYDLRQYHRAIIYYNQALAIARKVDYAPFFPFCYSGLAYAHYALNDFSKALLYSDSLQQETQRTKSSYLLMDAFELKSLIFEERGDFKNSLLYQRMHATIKDSLTLVENRKAMEEAEARFQNNLKQREIDDLKREQELKDIKLRQLHITQLAIGGALVLVLIIAGLVINRYRILNRASREIEIERMRNGIARDLHDDIGSALSSITIISNLAIKESNTDRLQENFKRIREQSSRVMESMSDIVWSINPENDTLDKILVKMREYAAELLEPRHIQFQLVASDLPTIELDATTRKNLFLIFKEALNNAIKYSECSQVNIAVSWLEKKLVLTIEDDGKGFDQSKIKTGNGLVNMKERAKALNGEIIIESDAGKGTRITVETSIT